MFNPSDNTPYPLPNIKAIVQATISPDLRAILDIVYPEIQYMRNAIESQNKTITDLQKLIATLMTNIDTYIGSEHMTAFKVTQHEHGKVGFAKFYEHTMSVKNNLATMQFTVDKIRDDMINIHIWKNIRDKETLEFKNLFTSQLEELRSTITVLDQAVEKHEVSITDLLQLKSGVSLLEGSLNTLSSKVDINSTDLTQLTKKTKKDISDLKNRVKAIEDFISKP